jgi:glycosyltransferase involved in cell wall biosynthesis
MRIGIEAQRLFRKKKHGMDIVALELIRHLQILDKVNEYFIFVKQDEDSSVIQETENFHIIQIARGPYPLWEQVLLPGEINRHKLDLLHCTSNTAPLKLNVPLVLTLHDIIYLEQWNFTRGTAYQIAGNLYRRWNVPAVVKKASRVITVSEFERHQIKQYFSFSDHFITTVHNGVGNHFRRISDPEILSRARAKFNLPDRYIFFLGNTDPKKNVVGVLKALSLLLKQGRIDFKLLMLDIDRTFLHEIAREIGDVRMLDYITFAGYVSNEELPAIYTMASLFLYPSLRESFGIPILEAMACGVPVITSQTSSMPEVAGDAAIFVDPANPESIATNIDQLMRDDSLRDRLTTAGMKRVTQFSWLENARKTLQIYQSVHGEK